MNPKGVQFHMVANAMALKESKNNFPAVKAIMSCLYEGSVVPFDTAIKIESKYFATLLSGTVARNMIRTLFVNKQAAEKGAARPQRAKGNRLQPKNYRQKSIARPHDQRKGRSLHGPH